MPSLAVEYATAKFVRWLIDNPDVLGVAVVVVGLLVLVADMVRKD